jgi:hypothetical protein
MALCIVAVRKFPMATTLKLGVFFYLMLGVLQAGLYAIDYPYESKVINECTLVIKPELLNLYTWSISYFEWISYFTLFVITCRVIDTIQI